METLYNEILDYFNGIGSIQPYDAACGFVWGCCKAILNPYRREFVHHTVLLAYISQSTTKHTAASVHRPSVVWPEFPQLWKCSALWSKIIMNTNSKKSILLYKYQLFWTIWALSIIFSHIFTEKLTISKKNSGHSCPSLYNASSKHLTDFQWWLIIWWWNLQHDLHEMIILQ